MNTPQEIFAKLQNKIKERFDEFSQISAVYKFVMNGTDGGTWIVDLRKETFGVREADEQANCTVTMKADDFVNLATGKLKPEYAFMRGKIKLSGDMGLAMKLGNLFKK